MKYVGSKAKLSKEIVPILQNIIDTYNIETYIEPFVGGANIIDKIKCKNKYGFDIDNIPISLLTKIPQNIKLLDELPEILTRDYYYYVKNNKTKFDDWYYSAIMLFGSYNNRVYGGCYGASSKTKEGIIRNYFKEGIKNLKKQIPNLSNIMFDIKDYKNIEIQNALIYCDPPYSNSIKYSQQFNNDEFWNWCREKSKNNIIIISEYNAPKDFICIWQKEIKVHIRNNKKSMAIEKLFTCNDVKSLNIVSQTSIFDNVKLLGDKK